MRFVPVFSVTLLLVVVTSACESRTAIPAGAQQVRITATPASVHVTPTTVHAGDVYLVLDPLPPGVAVAFVRSANGTGGALSDADLARLARNADAEGLSSEAMDVSCCGNVYKQTLGPGNFAIVEEAASAGQPGLPPRSIAVIDVRQ